MKRLLIILLLIAILFGLYFSIHNHYYSQASKPSQLTLYGNVDIRQVDLGFRVQGRLEKLFFEEGDFVPEGALMALLDKQPYQDLVKQAEAKIESDQISLRNNEDLFKRRESLVNAGAISQEDLQISQTTLAINRATIKEDQAALGVSLTNLQDTELYSPSNGTILTRIREPGAIVLPSEPIYTLSLISPIWVRAYVSERQLGDIYPGMQATIHTDREEGPIYTGHVGFISPVAEFTPKTVETTALRTDLVYRLRIIADNPDQGLKQGMPVTVQLPLNKENGAVNAAEQIPNKHAL